jgi:hypothetical protein
LKPGITPEQANQVLAAASTRWSAARAEVQIQQRYLTAARDIYRMLRPVFAEPDLASALHTRLYWSLLDARSEKAFLELHAGAVFAEIEEHEAALEAARAEVAALRQLAARPGVPVVYDTNMLLHWHAPDQVGWREVFQDRGETVPRTRVIVPLRVIDELDRQKYPQGDLGVRAATAIRFVERALRDHPPGEPVRIRTDAVLEIWHGADERGDDADLVILRCAVDLAGLHPGTQVRVLTGDLGMRLRAEHMGLTVMTLPEKYRKPKTAIGDVQAAEDAAQVPAQHPATDIPTAPTGPATA